MINFTVINTISTTTNMIFLNTSLVLFVLHVKNLKNNLKILKRHAIHNLKIRALSYLFVF